MNRRTFLSLVAGAAANSIVSANDLSSRRYLLLVELQGGNDGLNTVVPYTDNVYSELRPSLAIATDQLLKLDEKAALHPAMAPLMSAWKESQIAIVQGLGYDNPNRSHFRSHDIWTSASQSDQLKTTGWLADVLAEESSEVQALVFGARSAVFKGGEINYISMPRTGDFLDAKLPRYQTLSRPNTSVQRHVHAVLRDTINYQERLQREADRLRIKGKDDGGAFGNSLFGKQLKDAASLISLDLAPRVISLSLGGFDTHANQLERQHKKLAHLSQGLAAFREHMIAQGLWKNTLVMTWSEFGRRAVENGSGGTDHGTAAPQFVMGGSVKGGLHGQQPSLTQLQNDDLVHNLDFRQLYSTVLTNWWQAPKSLLSSQSIAPLDILKKV